jgi:hypothetical protein
MALALESSFSFRVVDSIALGVIRLIRNQGKVRCYFSKRSVVTVSVALKYVRMVFTVLLRTNDTGSNEELVSRAGVALKLVRVPVNTKTVTVRSFYRPEQKPWTVFLRKSKASLIC